MTSERENIFILAIFAMMESVGGFLLVCALLGIDLSRMAWTGVAGMIFGFAGILFAILLYFYYNKEQQK